MSPPRPPPPSQASFFHYPALSGPALGPAGSSRVRRPAVHTLLDRAVSPGLARLPLYPRQICGSFIIPDSWRQRLDPAVVLTPAGSSPPIRREIRRFAALICLPGATRGCLPELGDTGRAAIGLAGSFNSERS